MDNTKILLTNGIGSYTLLGEKLTSRYEGVYFHQDNKMFRVISDLAIIKPITKVTNYLWSVQRERQGLNETIFMPHGKNALIYRLSEIFEIEVILDGKETTDNRAWGRFYEYTNENNCLIIHFTKKNDYRDDNSLTNEEYEWYLAIYGTPLEFLPSGKWIEHFYPLDKSRNSWPHSRWVYSLGRLRTKDAVFSFSQTKQDAIKTAKELHSTMDKLAIAEETRTSKAIHVRELKDTKQNIALQCAIHSLLSLKVADEGLFAGIPWFTQYWIRDEAISARALALVGETEFAKKRLLNYISQIQNTDVKANSASQLASADGIGWVFVRIHEILEHLSRKEKQEITDKLRIAIQFIKNNKIKDGLVINEKNETWMDTDYNDNGRAGACIEIQALTLRMLKLNTELTGKKDPLYEMLLKNTRARFVRKNIVQDMKEESPTRPNVFVAAYVFPELFTKQQWTKTFDTILPKLWLTWGGLTTIDKKHPLFTPEYTGENNKSYHRGDSWYWINNLAATVLSRTSSKYNKYVTKILDASTKEILTLGAIGHHAELSSAKEKRAEGCLAQAWSAAMYIEAMTESKL